MTPPSKRDEEEPEEAPEAAEGTSEEAAPSKKAASGPPIAGPTFSSKLRRGLRTARFPISLFVLVVGAVVFLLGLFAWTPVAQSGPLEGLEQGLLGSSCNAGSNYVNGACTSTNPDWTLAMLPGGGILALVGAYMAITYVVARRRFEHLMKTKSKAEFLRNVTEAEDLLWDLTPEDEIRLVRKKQDLKIRG